MSESHIAQIHSILKSCQVTSAVHLKNVLIVQNLIENDDSVVEDIIKLLKSVFVIDYKDLNASIQRAIDFFSLLLANFQQKCMDSSNPDHPVFVQIFEFLKKCSCCSHEFARYWSCKLLEKTFSRLEEVSDYVFTEMKETMLQRLNDCVAVRYQAVLVLSRLQEGNSLDDPVIREFHSIIQLDQNSKVRQLCLEKIRLIRPIIPTVIERTRDINSAIRLVAFKKIAKCFKFLKPIQKIEVFKNGFYDSDVQTYFLNDFLNVSLEMYNNDILEYVKAFRLNDNWENVAESVELAEKILQVFFEKKHFPELVKFIKIDEAKLIEFASLTWDNILCYRIFVQYLRKNQAFEEQLNAIVPDLVVFCQYIKDFYKYAEENVMDELQTQFTLQQLFMVCQGYDLSDDCSRKCIKSLCYEFLQQKQLNSQVVTAIVQNMQICLSNENDFAIYFVEIISNIACGNVKDFAVMADEECERNKKISELRAEIHQLKDEANALSAEQKFDECKKVKELIDEKMRQVVQLEQLGKENEGHEIEIVTCTETILKYLIIAEAFLSSIKVTKMLPSIATMKTLFIDPIIEHVVTEIRVKALKCFGLCAFIDENVAKNAIHIFAQTLLFCTDFDEVDENELIVAIQASVDLLLKYNFDIIAEPANEILSTSYEEDQQKTFYGGTSLSDIVKALTTLSDYDNIKVQEVTIIAICKLIIYNRIQSVQLITRLLLKWASPATDDSIREIIGNAFIAVPKLKDFPNFIEVVFVNAIKTILSAPSHSALNDINIDNLIRFMLNLCKMTLETDKIYESLAKRLCTELVLRKNAKYVVSYSKVLSQLKLAPPLNEDVLELAMKAEEHLKGNSNVKKFLNNLKNLISV